MYYVLCVVCNFSSFFSTIPIESKIIFVLLLLLLSTVYFTEARYW